MALPIGLPFDKPSTELSVAGGATSVASGATARGGGSGAGVGAHSITVESAWLACPCEEGRSPSLASLLPAGAGHTLGRVAACEPSSRETLDVLEERLNRRRLLVWHACEPARGGDGGCGCRWRDCCCIGMGKVSPVRTGIEGIEAAFEPPQEKRIGALPPNVAPDGGERY